MDRAGTGRHEVDGLMERAAAKASADDQARYQAWGAATAKQMTAEQLAAARTLAREWQAAFDKAAR